LHHFERISPWGRRGMLRILQLPKRKKEMEMEKKRKKEEES